MAYQEILDLMEKRRQVADRRSQEYKYIDRNIKKDCNVAKEGWLNNKCSELEQSKHSSSVHKRIKELTAKVIWTTSSGCIKAKNGDIIMDREKILERWVEYIGE